MRFEISSLIIPDNLSQNLPEVREPPEQELAPITDNARQWDKRAPRKV